MKIETFSYLIMRKVYSLRFIRSSFKEPSSGRQVIGFKLAKPHPEFQSISIYIVLSDQKPLDPEAEAKLINISAYVNPTTNYENIKHPRKTVAYTILYNLMRCFSNLETYLNLEFLAYKPITESSECSELSDIETTHILKQIAISNDIHHEEGKVRNA